MEMICLVYLKITNILPLKIHCFSPSYRVWDGTSFYLERGKEFHDEIIRETLG